MTAALILSYTVFPADGINTVYAAGSVSASDSVKKQTASLPTVTSHPKSLTAKVGDVVKFSVSAKGTGTVKYQWYYKKAGASQWTFWKNHTSATTEAVVNDTWNLIKVRCKITDNNGSVYSNEATVTLDRPLTILTQPKNVTVGVDQPTKFTVKAQGKGTLKYQWYYKKPGAAKWSLWKGRTTASTTAVSNASWNMMKVICKVTDASGSIYSSAATITINQPLKITSQPKSVTVKVNEKVKFSVTAQGKGTLKYQWYFKKADSTSWKVWKNLTQASMSSVSNASWNMMQVRCKVTDATGSVYSDPAVIYISVPLAITVQPKDVFAKEGTAFKLSVTAQGTGTLSYQWYQKALGAADWTLWKNQTAASVSATASAVMDGMQFYCAVADSTGSKVNSSVVTVVTSNNPKITSQPKEVLLASGDTATFSISAYGQAPLTYQWYYKKAGKKDWIKWEGKTAPTITATADCTWNGMQVYCRVTDSKNNYTDSNTVYAMITKIGSKRYFTRTITIKSNYTKVYDGVGKNTTVVGKINAKKSFTAQEWAADANDTTWYRFIYNGRNVWVPRTSVNVVNNYTAIPDRKFNDGGIPVIYISPSKQPDNAYAYGSTTEQEQMYRVGNALKKILDEEYYCITHIPSTALPLGLHNRAYDAYIRDADVYLAIHSNAISSKAVYGSIGYYSPNCNQSKQLSQNIVTEMNKICIKKPTIKNQLREGMSAYDNTGYGEVRDPSYYGMVGVLAKVEYHDNKDSAKWIINNTDKIARALANALEKTFGLQKK